MSSSEQATSNPIFQLVINALADYANLTGIDLANNPFMEKIELSTSPEAILELLQEREKAFKEYRDVNRGLINRLSPAVRVLQAFSGILGEAIPFSPAKAVFTSVDVLLAAASGVSSSYDALLELFDCLGSFLKRLEIYVTIPPTTMMTDIIVQIMVEVVLVLALATKQVKQGRLKKFAEKLLGDSEVEAVLQRLNRLTQEEARMTVVQTLGVVHGLVSNMKAVMEDGKASTELIRQYLVTLHQMLKEVNEIKRNTLQCNVQHWLSPPDPSTNHNFVRKVRHNGTAVWFFESDVFTEWKARGSLLWIHGKPGAGKSTLLSAVIQDIEGMKAAGLATMIYYYFDFRDLKKQDVYGLLSSLISQLSAESDSCYDILSRLYLDHGRGVRKPDIDALTRCTKDMLSLSGQSPIYVVVDGLDECPNLSGTPSAREEVLDLIEELVDLKLPNVHLCVASRPEMDIRTVLEPLTSLQVSLHDESGQKKDIIAYIKSVVRSDRSMRRWREEDKQLVIDSLSNRADGMFRWVVCQVDRLRRTLPASLRRVLNDLPMTLDETYCRTLLGIDGEKREYAQRLFRCLTVSIRPLRVEELAEILAIQFDEAAPPTFDPAWRLENAEEAVISVCSSLIAIVDRGKYKVVQFTHFSVREFLTSERLATAEGRLSYYHIFPEHAHIVLAHAGLSVLLRIDDKIDRDTIGNFPLAPYAAQHWVDHAQFGNVSSHIQKVMEHLFDPAKPHFSAWVWLYDIDHHWTRPMSSIHPTKPEAVSLYYASLCGFSGLVEHLIAAHSSDVNGRGGSHTTALHAASVKGHLEVALLLLKNGADPNSRDHSDRAPLHRVSQGGQLVMAQSPLKIARLLINSGADVNVTDYEGLTPLHAAAKSGSRDLAELLLGSGAVLDVLDKNQHTPLNQACHDGRLDVSRFLLLRGSDMNIRDKRSLHIASASGHIDIARLLLDHGSDVNECNARGCSPLHYASGCGHLDLARFLIDRGAYVNAPAEHRWTPMDLASANGHLDIAKLLFERGANIGSQNEGEKFQSPSAAGYYSIARLIGDDAATSFRDIQGWTPLHTASYFGHLHITEFLLECGIDADVRDDSEETPLYLASSRGKFYIVESLIEHGADIHTHNNKTSSPLHIASQNGHLDVVRMLISAGIAVDIRNDTQETPLALASSKGKVDVARYLIELGVNINVQNNRGWSPLHFASKHGWFDMVRLLLDHGVDVNIQCNDLWVPLHLASANGHLKIAELLAQSGASVDIFNDKQETPLFHAASEGKVAIARTLIDHGANLHTADSNGSTLLHVASQRGHLEVVKVLLRWGADVDVVNKANKTAAELALENDKAEVVKFFSEYKADGKIRNTIRSSTSDAAQDGADEDGKDNVRASLNAAVEEGNIDILESLLKREDIHSRRGASNETPLHRAAANGKVDIVRLLIKLGAEVDSRGKLGQTPLHNASLWGHLEVSRVLVDHGADVNARKINQATPLDISARNGRLGVVKLLLEHGADVHAINGDGETPYQISLQRGHREVADLLWEQVAGRTSDSAAWK